jgi:hypothetical protein
MLLQTLPVWHMQNLISVMINCILVMVRDLLYLIQLIIFCILQNGPLLCLISYMFDKFCCENCLFWVSLFFSLKDLITKKVLLSGQSKDGLYILLESSTMFMPQVFLSTSIDVWHCWLSHSSSHILSLLVSNKKVICTFHHLNFHCQVCPLGKSLCLSLEPTGHKCLLLLNLFLLMFGALLLCYLRMAFDILLFFWMQIQNLSSFTLLSSNLMYSICFINFKSWWLVLKSVFLSRFYIIILHLKYQ